MKMCENRRFVGKSHTSLRVSARARAGNKVSSKSLPQFFQDTLLSRNMMYTCFMVNTADIYEELVSYLDNLSEQEWALIVFDSWTVKDIISHLIGWIEMASQEVPRIWMTDETPWFMKTDDYGDFNQKHVSQLRDRSGKEILRRFKESENAFDLAIQSIGTDKLRKQGSKYAWVFDEGEDNHYLEHFKQIKMAVEGYRSKQSGT
ncbi:hypothetical protein CO112_00325 [Candidatus Dojkabacteria bacterium CG_4_9_14_3_um_filter_150_Dojkabacteria_WS6_41_13]|uniref:Mycothiol-dependent maleylpyruvate isomerase metal-binding domain-containing protein n=1 Tax=Candidatus Dojkabacteria bacterium CG_4_10_14_0_2_um_filter_Dojkabacteria_WS6_41_15 TaxID=2014249 RepID=A0A2M7W2J9_9BACT|nr:MAG: hypothetical protein COZ14_00880 [Candidatus Dojkabacteria bacterium CG_4_10_14_3_um_filter_Dojkabacteria_WS6_41_9]PJA14825.1 MAG: hypothetical protein COX64_01555 [Candidatus Dojkabacteria bacterium CG_4_10_14_0_2_um_filter_Dojkabacteria_WS6_41_15]PJB23885.1 MAG: hypothetical protein CO112_00325 [Candidatus Dojkabacteria bacterium CG_4_9_14_3_um_filter_150_Dojkabacteria_WS6_41_13]